MKILAFAASNSRASVNKALIRHAASRIEAGPVSDAVVEIIDLNDYEMPLYSIDRETEDGIPQLAHDFLAKIEEADAVLVSFAEHNGSYTVAYKNIFDWASRTGVNVYQDTPVVFLSASPGPGGGANVLRTAVSAAPHQGAELLGSMSVPSIYDNFDFEGGVLTNGELAAQLDEVLASLGAVAS